MAVKELIEARWKAIIGGLVVLVVAVFVALSYDWIKVLVDSAKTAQLPDALKQADGVFISQVARLDQIPEKERLDPQAVMESIAASGRPAFYEPDAAHIIEKLVPLLKEKDVVAIFSNGGFDGIHGKLLAALAA